MNLKQALKKSIDHWEDNVRKLKKAKGAFVNFGGKDGSTWAQKIRIGKTLISYDSDNCALCQYKDNVSEMKNCEDMCPLSRAGFECDAPFSSWENIYNSTDQKQALASARAMLKTLKSKKVAKYAK